MRFKHPPESRLLSACWDDSRHDRRWAVFVPGPVPLVSSVQILNCVTVCRLATCRPPSCHHCRASPVSIIVATIHCPSFCVHALRDHRHCSSAATGEIKTEYISTREMVYVLRNGHLY